MQNLDAELEAKTVVAAPTVASTPVPATQAREPEHAKGPPSSMPPVLSVGQVGVAVVAVVVVRYLLPKMIALVLRRIEVRTGPGCRCRCDSFAGSITSPCSDAGRTMLLQCGVGDAVTAMGPVRFGVPAYVRCRTDTTGVTPSLTSSFAQLPEHWLRPPLS